MQKPAEDYTISLPVYVAIAVGILLFLSWSRRRLSEIVEESKRREMIMGGQQENAKFTPHTSTSLPNPAGQPDHHSTSANDGWGSKSPEEEHEEPSEGEKQQAEEALKKKSSLFSSLMTVLILVIAAINYYMKTREELVPPPQPQPSPSEQRAAPEQEPGQQRALEHSAEEAPVSKAVPENEAAVEAEAL